MKKKRRRRSRVSLYRECLVENGFSDSNIYRYRYMNK